MNHKRAAGQSGNVLFLILIAVALFAALSFIVATTSRSGGGDTTREKASLAVAEYLQYTNQIDVAVQRMLLTGKVKETQLDFSTPELDAVSETGANAGCLSTRCRVFHPGGGNALAKRLSKFATDQTTTSGKANGQSTPKFRLLQVVGVGSDRADIAMLYQSVSKDFCDELNRRTGVTTQTVTALNYDSHGAHLAFTGNMNPMPQPTGTLGEEEPLLQGHHDFCIRSAPSSDPTHGNYLWHVILAR